MKIRCALLTVSLALIGAVAHAETKPSAIWSPAASDNYTAVGYNRGIYYIVIHTIEGSASGALSWFKNPSSNVSAHYVVAQDGELYQCVADKNIAWHAGNWYYNVHSIGIEHEGWAYSPDTWTEEMYQKSAWLVRWLCEYYGIPKNRSHIIGHNEVPGATHTDPGPYFDWDYFMSLVKDSDSDDSDVPPETSTTSLTAKKCTASSLNVRAGPGTSYAIIGGIFSGQIYVTNESSNGWYKIWYDGNTGWCYGGYLATVSSPGVKVNTDVLNVRTGPGIGYRKVGIVTLGQHYARVTSSNGWHKIYWGGGKYWVYGGYTVSEDY